MAKQGGFTLIETLIALGLLGFIGVAFMSSMTSSLGATDLTDVRVTGENLVRAQLEYIRRQAYFRPPTAPYLIPPENAPGAYAVPPPGITPPPGYLMTLEIAQYCDSTGCYPLDQIELVTAKVTREGRPITHVSNLKTKR
ncbi:MAG: type II secretion system protein [Chloroflexi bacterium]|nr:type II secretion system protein [Chloroflexota bacterium]